MSETTHILVADAVASESFNESRAIGAELEEASLLRRILPKSAEQSPGHVRVALLQWNLDETYSHPITEVGAQKLQFKESGVVRQVSQLLAGLDEGDTKSYGQLHQATEKRGTEYLWTEKKDLPSWAEHRRHPRS